MSPRLLFLIAWNFWIISWLLAAFWSGRTERRVSGWEVWAYRSLVVAGIVLSLHGVSDRLGAPKLWHVGFTGAYVLVAATFAGIAFTWWARIHLGPLWSGSITRKENHHVVDTGPYGLVRHPIYTGLLAATIATCVAKATWPALLGCALIIAALWWKAKIEERFLSVELEAEAYAAYRRRVPMLVPFLPS